MIFAQIFDMVNIGIVILDPDLRVKKWNRWMETHSKLPNKKIVSSLIFDFFPNLNAPWFLRNFKSVIAFGNFAFFSQKLHGYCFPFKESNTIGANFEYMQQSCTMGPLRNEKNEISHVYITVQDVTEIAAYEKKLIEMNIKDALTGVFNRRFLETRLAEEFERHRRYSRSFSLIMQDIDHFKKVNDTYGHQAGDFILKEFSKVVRSRIRSVDIMARYGGEEFCCMLPETNLSSAEALAEHLRKNIETHFFKHNDSSIRITVSQGVSELNASVQNAEGLLKLADEALYAAKTSGRNRVICA